MPFVIVCKRTQEFAGLRFPSRTVSERPDAVEYATRAKADRALKDAEWRSCSSFPDHGFEVVED